MKLSLVACVTSLSSCLVALVACTPPPRPARPPTARAEAALHVTETRPPAIDHHAQAEREAADVFRTMHEDLLACFTRARVVVPEATAHVFVDVLVGPDGAVREVAARGGARVGAHATTCMERRIARATFSAPRGGGTSRIQVPFAFSFEP